MSVTRSENQKFALSSLLAIVICCVICSGCAPKKDTSAKTPANIKAFKGAETIDEIPEKYRGMAMQYRKMNEQKGNNPKPVAPPKPK